MYVSATRLDRIAKRCLATSLGGLAAIAVLVNLAFYGAMADYWLFARLFGPVVVFGSAFIAGLFLFGFLMEGVAVLLARRRLPSDREATAEEWTARRAA